MEVGLGISWAQYWFISLEYGNKGRQPSYKGIIVGTFHKVRVGWPEKLPLCPFKSDVRIITEITILAFQ